MTTEERRQHKEREIRAAMERLLTGRAIHTAGACNVSTLAGEAGVSRQGLYRSYGALLEEFGSHLRRIQESGALPDKQGAELRRIDEKRAEAVARAARYRLERDDARSERDANASCVAYLEEQNRLLRRHLDVVQSVSPLRRKES